MHFDTWEYLILGSDFGERYHLRKEQLDCLEMLSAK